MLTLNNKNKNKNMSFENDIKVRAYYLWENDLKSGKPEKSSEYYYGLAKQIHSMLYPIETDNDRDRPVCVNCYQIGFGACQSDCYDDDYDDDEYDDYDDDDYDDNADPTIYTHDSETQAAFQREFKDYQAVVDSVSADKKIVKKDV